MISQRNPFELFRQFFVKVYTNHCIDITVCACSTNAKIPILKSIEIKIINNNNILKTWYRINAANIRLSPF